jgi:hypothetical protein
MNKGVPAKLFKNDGSVSDLLVLVTNCCKEINCVDKNEPGMVKPKWRVAINEITCIEMYGDEATWRKSNFYKSSFMGKSNKFKIFSSGKREVLKHHFISE